MLQNTVAAIGWPDVASNACLHALIIEERCNLNASNPALGQQTRLIMLPVWGLLPPVTWCITSPRLRPKPSICLNLFPAPYFMCSLSLSTLLPTYCN
jgi:hypothetical protein